MNRGRRRGGTGLSGLRDGVKRRLFDPHSVPMKPDAKYEVNRLVPLSVTPPAVFSRIDHLRHDPVVDGPEDKPGASRADSLRFRALMELAFRAGPFYHPVPTVREGLEIGHAFLGHQVENSDEELDSAGDETNSLPISLSHLLLAYEDIETWGKGEPLKNLDDPELWYPKELAQFTKIPKSKAAKRARKKQRQAERRAFASTDLDSVVPEELARETLSKVDTSNAGDTIGTLEVMEQSKMDDIVEPDEDEKAEESDAEDARWNCEVNAEADPDELDQDELDNDYCQTYFDNGEGDASDGIGGDDDEGGGRYSD
ncbi:unnamed protein product [Calicophoron daubneyi]|uniref:DNA-directed RNA polymerase III subunit n=1 Tax=Calicophoron daubneyi TaxID=300641 RepID=A0AAV2T5D5_CALDB